MSTRLQEIIGEYRIFLNGEEVHSQKNAMTTYGKTAAMKTLIGQTLRFAGSIGIGTSSAASTFDANGRFITNTKLGFELKKFDITSTFVDISEEYSKIVFRTSIKDNIRYKIRELGLFSPENAGGGRSIKANMLVEFEPTTTESLVDQYDNTLGTTVTTSSAYFVDYTVRPQTTYGINSVALPGASATVTKKTTSTIPRYSDSDQLTISYIKDSAFASVLRLYLYTDSYYQYYDFSNSNSGSIIQSVALSSTSGTGGTGSIDWDRITSIKFENRTPTAANILYLDGLRFDTDPGVLDTANAMLSRVVLTNEIESSAGDEIELEYNLSLGFNEGI